MIGELVALASTIQSENHHQAAGLFVYKTLLATPTIIFCPITHLYKHTHKYAWSVTCTLHHHSKAIVNLTGHTRQPDVVTELNVPSKCMIMSNTHVQTQKKDM